MDLPKDRAHISRLSRELDATSSLSEIRYCCDRVVSRCFHTRRETALSGPVVQQLLSDSDRQPVSCHKTLGLSALADSWQIKLATINP